MIVAPEVCLTGFDYDNLDEASEFSYLATSEIQKLSKDKIVIVTMIEKIDGEVFNIVKVFNNGNIIHKRAKAKLFRLGNEHKYMQEGNDENIKIIKVDGIKLGILVCFELRFKKFWQELEGCDVIAVPSWWGVLRTEHFKTLTNALAIINQCYVVASDSLNEECSKMSGIIKPNGEHERNGNKPCLEGAYNKKEIITMRRYMDIGIE